MTELTWGKHYAMVRPDHFRVDYRINPFMDLADQPDPLLARDQWDHLVAAIEDNGGAVEVLEQRDDAPDMVYAMNLGLAMVRPDGGPSMVMSHMRHAERRMETGSAQPFFADLGYATSYVGREGVGAHFEAGDAFAWGDALVVGYGPRSDELALKHLATDLDVRVRGFRITHPGMYHLDLAFCPLDERRAIVCPAAFDEASAAALLELVPEPLILSETDALETFAANSIVLGKTILMPACPDSTRAQLEEWGFEILLLELGEFHKGGGSIRCLTNPLDVTIGRDLPVVVGGEVVIP
ncbi:arginine deiminase-related protein [Nocardioides sp. InS609-2]|uniref:dimethylarginine dimethylaminohydrolase family protein n=1 Tax=Nocardioides sp. InS609-2 TaxID=2760705 RepID=UPI0020BF87FE|nr:arginine deiminase-related protein [Nocardioides sp. InS609-2]